MTVKKLIAAVVLIFTTLFCSCTNDSVKDSLVGTKWTAILPDDEGWLDLDFISDETVVLIFHDYDGTVEARVSGSYTYNHPIVDFSVIYDDWCNKFKTKIIGSEMPITWVDEDIDFEIEGLTFKRQ